jgi:hypothetical protein
LDAVRVAASLVESIKKFRNAMEPTYVNMDSPAFDLGREYITMLEEGVLAAQYLESWRNEDKDAVLVAPAYSFLMMNRPVTVQFWLDPGSRMAGTARVPTADTALRPIPSLGSGPLVDGFR